MLSFQLYLQLDNAAMSDPDHVAHALQNVASVLLDSDHIPTTGKIRDENGNTVGNWFTSDSEA